MAGLPPSLIAQLNAAGARSRSSSAGSGSASLMQLANALANGNRAANSDPLASAQKKLQDQLAAIAASNAPKGAKNAAADAASGSPDRSNMLNNLLYVVGYPNSLVRNSIARVIDPSRDLPRDLRMGTSTGELLGKADWFKDLNPWVKAGIGIVGDIATDPLTYVAPGAALSKVGGATGLSKVLGEAAVAAKAAGKIDDAATLTNISGRLLMKGKGGIGGLTNAELKTASELAAPELAKLGITQPLKGGLYLNTPGTGRVGSFISKKLTGSGFDPVQIPLGRPELVRKISAGASNLSAGIKTSKVMSNLSDTYGGGLGAMKRAVLTAETPEDALKARRVLMSEQVKNGSEAVFAKTMERRFVLVDKVIAKAKVDPQRVAGALDGTVEDIKYLDQVAPGLVDQVREIDNRLLSDSFEQLKRVVSKYGGSEDDLKELAAFQEDHFRGFLTPEARAAIDASGGVGDASRGVFGFMKQARYRPGADHMGVAISHPTQDLTRATITDAKGVQRTLLQANDLPAAVAGADGAAAEQAINSVGDVLSDSPLAKQRFVEQNKLEQRLKAAERQAKKAKTPEELDAARQELQQVQKLIAQSNDGMVNVRFYNDAGQIETMQVPISQVQTEVLPAGGVGAKTQVNAINREKIGYDLFDMNYRDVVQRQIGEVSRALGEEVQGQILRKYGLSDLKRQSVEELVGNDVAAAKAVAANANDPETMVLVAATADAKNTARMDLPSEASDFSILSLTPEQQIEHFDGVIAEVKAKAAKLERASKSSKPEKVKDIERSLERTQSRIEQANAKFDEVSVAIDEAKAAGASQETIDSLVGLQESIRVLQQADTTAVRMLTVRQADEAAFKTWMSSTEGIQGLQDQVMEGWVSISRHTKAPQEVKDLMALMTRATGPDKLPGVLRYFDKLTSLFKSWAIASPGFIMRNGFGGMFNNYLVGVDPGRYMDFLKADRAFTKALNSGSSIEQAFLKVPSRLREDYTLLHTSGVLAETDRISDAAFGLQKGLGQIDQTRDAMGFLGNNPITRSVYNGNSRMERVLRGAAGMDAAAKTKSLDGIYDVVFKAHFDYADLNRFEVNVMKRVSPFYTWTRKNLPLQLEMLFKNPKAFDRYLIFKNNIEAMTPAEDLVPQWMQDRLNIRLPFQAPGGQAYILPDLPFTSLNMFTNADELAGQINPLIKLPAEMAMDRKLYFGKSAPFAEGFVPVHPVLEKTGIAAAMGAVGMAERTKDGQWVTRDKTLYAVEQLLPFFGRMRRLLPAEDKYNERAATTWLNFVFGAGLRTNTTTDKKSELFFRSAKLDKIAKDLNSLGYGGYSYWNKRVETSSKPSATDKRPYLSLNQPKGGLGANSPYTNVSSSKMSSADLQRALNALASRSGKQ